MKPYKIRRGPLPGVKAGVPFAALRSVSGVARDTLGTDEQEARRTVDADRSSRSLPGRKRRCLKGSRERRRRSRDSRVRVASELKSGGGGHHRRPAGVNGGDDLFRVDALQVDAGRAEVGVPELALD